MTIAGSDPQVTNRLFAILAIMIGFICIFGGYMLGRMARNEIKPNDLLTFNLTTAADNLYTKAKRLSPKAVHNHDADKIKAKLVSIFDFTHCNCPPTLDKYNIADFIKNAINIQVTKLMKSVHNASVFLNTLR